MGELAPKKIETHLRIVAANYFKKPPAEDAPAPLAAVVFRSPIGAYDPAGEAAISFARLDAEDVFILFGMSLSSTTPGKIADRHNGDTPHRLRRIDLPVEDRYPVMAPHFLSLGIDENGNVDPGRHGPVRTMKDGTLNPAIVADVLKRYPPQNG